MPESPTENSGDQLSTGKLGDEFIHGEKMGLRDEQALRDVRKDCGSGDHRVGAGRPCDFKERKRTRSIVMTDYHWELWRKAAHPLSCSHWLALHLEENKDRIDGQKADN